MTVTQNHDCLWLFNFSHSYTGGGLTRLKETAKWFSGSGGAVFIVNKAVQDQVDLAKGNTYYFVYPDSNRKYFNKFKYVKEIINEVGRPDIYFSYGIPVSEKFGKLNWFHLSNALSLTTKGINLPLLTKFKQIILKKRLKKSLSKTNVVTCESLFSINLFKKTFNSYKNIQVLLLKNGFDKKPFERLWNSSQSDCKRYAITVGSYRYKRLDVVKNIYQQLKKENINLDQLYIIGKPEEIPESIRSDPEIKILSGITTKKLLKLIYDAEYYISASQIENGSMASLEGLLLAKNTILSSIPAHLELINGLEKSDLILKDSMEEFVYVDNIVNRHLFNYSNWDEICSEMFNIGQNYLEQNNW